MVDLLLETYLQAGEVALFLLFPTQLVMLIWTVCLILKRQLSIWEKCVISMNAFLIGLSFLLFLRWCGILRLTPFGQELLTLLPHLLFAALWCIPLSLLLLFGWYMAEYRECESGDLQKSLLFSMLWTLFHSFIAPCAQISCLLAP